MLKKQLSSNFEIIGKSEAINKVKELIQKVAPTDARVLITGSNGTGKELVARQLHEKSNRVSGSFVEVNCAAIPSELIESELFGHEKGAFTSALKQRKGKFEQADSGTIFLDEIGDMTDRYHVQVVAISALKKEGLEQLLKVVKETIPEYSFKTPSLLGDLVGYGDVVLLITPIDVEAPAGRLILPQVQAIRDVLDNDAVAIVLKEREVDGFLRKTGIKPALAVTDSQIFNKADAAIPRDIPLTSFSTLLARFKGDFESYLKGTPKIATLKDGDKVLILESCTHHGINCGLFRAKHFPYLRPSRKSSKIFIVYIDIGINLS